MNGGQSAGDQLVRSPCPVGYSHWLFTNTSVSLTPPHSLYLLLVSLTSTFTTRSVTATSVILTPQLSDWDVGFTVPHFPFPSLTLQTHTRHHCVLSQLLSLSLVVFLVSISLTGLHTSVSPVFHVSFRTLSISHK